MHNTNSKGKEQSTISIIHILNIYYAIYMNLYLWFQNIRTVSFAYNFWIIVEEQCMLMLLLEHTKAIWVRQREQKDCDLTDWW